MPREPSKYLWDMAEACRLIRTFIAGKSLEDYEADVLLRSAVERQLQIAGEALFPLHRSHPSLASRIDRYDRIIGFRHVLVHGYDAVRDDIVWGIVLDYLPALQEQVSVLLDEADRA